MKQFPAIIIILIALFFSSCKQKANIYYSDQWEFLYPGQTEWTDTMSLITGKYRLRTEIELDDSLDKFASYSLYLDMLASSVAYWDSVKIGENGIVGNGINTEIPGKKVTYFKIPDTLLFKGTHKVEIELSNFHAGSSPRFYLIVAVKTKDIGRQPMIITSYIHIYAGCFLIMGLFYLVRYFTNRKRYTHLIFSILSISFFALILVEFMRNYYHYEYSWHFSRLKIILGITIINGILLPMFFLFQFRVQHKWKILGLILFLELLCLNIIPSGYDYATWMVMLTGFTSASMISFAGMKKEFLEGGLANIVLIPAIICFLIWPHYYDYIVYISFGNLTSVMLVILALNDKKSRDEKEEVKLRSARLELELLKKNIQPHFMKNSLTSAIDWIERNPKKGTELIFALVDEFDLLLSISDRKLIPINQELELCQKHLEIMSFRKEVNYGLKLTGIESGVLIPPAIILTVIENGITHNLAKSKNVLFEINHSTEGRWTTYSILSQGVYQLESDSREGTGTKYIKARLEESFPGKWKFQSHPSQNGWKTKIQWSN